MAETPTQVLRKSTAVRVLSGNHKGEKATVVQRDGYAYLVRLASGITRWLNDTQIVEVRS